MLDEQLKSLVKLHMDITLTLLDKLPTELSRPLKACGKAVHEAVGEALSAHEDKTPPEKSSSVPIE